MSNEPQKIINLTVSEAGVRVDKYIAENAGIASRSQIQKLIIDGQVLLNGKLAKSGIKLNEGDRLSINLPPPVPATLASEDIPVEIIYEDVNVLVVNKPPGLTVHPAPGHPDGTLVNALLSHLPTLAESPLDSGRPGIVHRLDKDTSGVMVVAKNSASHASLTEQFRSRSVSKTYLVLVKGRLSPPEGAIEAPIGRDPSHREKMAVVTETRGRHARTEYRVREYLDGYTLLEVKPETGRTHQIRVHLGAIGFPVMGDKVYGVKPDIVPRQFVHAYRLGFKLPSTGEYREFTAALPADLAQALEKLRAKS